MTAANTGCNAVVRRNSYGRIPQFDTTKAKTELGLRFLLLETTVKDMAASALKLGIAK